MYGKADSSKPKRKEVRRNMGSMARILRFLQRNILKGEGNIVPELHTMSKTPPDRSTGKRIAESIAQGKKST